MSLLEKLKCDGKTHYSSQWCFLEYKVLNKAAYEPFYTINFRH